MIYDNFLNLIVEYQYTFNKLISSTIKDINNENSIILSFSLLGIALIYGLVHAAGPGHGKALVGFYLIWHAYKHKKDKEKRIQQNNKNIYIKGKL